MGGQGGMAEGPLHQDGAENKGDAAAQHKEGAGRKQGEQKGRKAPLHRLGEDWDWTKEPVYRKYVDEKDYKPHYSAIITGPQLSLPVDVPFTFTAQCPSGKVIPMASSLRQHEQLLELNEACWKATPEEILSWKETYKDASILEERAKQAYSVYYALSNFCMEHNVPMMLVF